MEAHLTVEEGPETGQVFVVHPGQTYDVGRRGVEGVSFALRDADLPGSAVLSVRLEPGGVQVTDHGGPLRATLNDAPLAPRVATPARGGDALGVGAHVLRVEVFGLSPAAAPAPPLATGIPADEFEVVRQLGQGATGRVFSAVRRADRRPVALKVLWDWLELGGEDEARFTREARIAGQVRSPFIVEVLELRRVAGRPMIVMELVDGPSVEQLLDPDGEGWAFADAMRICEDVARGLAAAAAGRVIHRDVKPGNVLLAPEGRAKLTDFGVARKLSDSMGSLTRTGAGLGTLVYMAPEQISEAKGVDARADLYALGAMLHELVAGATPFVIDTVDDLVDVVDASPPGLRALRPDCPPELEALALHLLAKHPDDRPASAAIVAERLAAMRARFAPGHTGAHLFTG